MHSLDDLLDTAITAARAAGEVHLQHAGAPLATRAKGHPADLVTEVDQLAEARIRAVIGWRHPDHAILGEEGGRHGEGARLWLVDPLDGTVNYARGLPMSAVSVAYQEAGECLVGVVYDPQRGELYSAQRDRGARLNGRPVRVSSCPALDAPALLATGFPRDLAHRPEVTRPFLTLVGRGLPVRRYGCAALSLAYLACGRLDAYWDVKLAPWDVAAGALLIEEAGGRVSDLEGGPFEPGGPLAASNAALHPELLAVLADRPVQVRGPGHG